MNNRLPNRSLTVTADGEPFPFSGRMRLRGEDNLSLFPALFTLELWNLPEEYDLRLYRTRRISVSHDDACLISGAISDVFRHPSRDGILTTVAVSLGLDLWESVVSLTVPAGTLLSDTVRRILASSGTGIPLLSFPDTDPALPRGQSDFGRASECIASVLLRHPVPSGVIPGAAAGSFPRAMLTPSGLMVVSATSIGATAHRADRLFRLTSALSEFPPLAADSASPDQWPQDAIHITETDLTDVPAFAGGSLRNTPPLMILSAAVSGWRPGQTVEVDCRDVHARGLITGRRVDADTGDGAWKCEMVCEVTPGSVF